MREKIACKMCFSKKTSLPQNPPPSEKTIIPQMERRPVDFSSHVLSDVCLILLQAIHGAERGEPAALFLSPSRPAYQNSSDVDSGEKGSQFTLFLTSPLLAFCQMVGLSLQDVGEVFLPIVQMKAAFA